MQKKNGETIPSLSNTFTLRTNEFLSTKKNVFDKINLQEIVDVNNFNQSTYQCYFQELI